MVNLLLLYDIKEKDLARDIKDFLEEVGIHDIKMIPLSADKGLTLQEKEQHYFSTAHGAIFLITPGSERSGKWFPSPSVADEMGQAKERFKKTPEKLIYLVDDKCHIQSIDQRCRVEFDRSNARSVIEAVTLLVKNLKAADLLMTKAIEKGKPPDVNIATFCKKIPEQLKDICFDISKEYNGCISPTKLDGILTTKYNMDTQKMNFAKRDLQVDNLVTFVSEKNYYGIYWQLTHLGWEVAHFETERKRKEQEMLLGIFAAGKRRHELPRWLQQK